MKKIHFDLHSPRTVANVIVICLAIIMGFSVVAEEYNTASMTFSLDNDGLLGSDRGYTNGLFFKYNSISTVDIKDNSPLILKTIGNWLPLHQETNKSWGITFGQQIWTPTDLKSLFEGENDRPYTGLLFIKANITEFSSDFANKYSLMLGAVGPNAFGESSQKSVHSLIGSPKPMGWGRQIENQTVFNLSYERQQLLTRSAAWLDKDYDIGLSGRANLGNYQTEIALGSTMRWGDALHESFASVGVMPGNYIDSSVLAKSRSGQFYYVALEARYRFQDITIDGARPKPLFDVHTEHWQATISTGGVYYQESWGLAISVVTSSPDYKEDLRNYNSTASVEMFWRI
jgi:hypothetical protein